MEEMSPDELRGAATAANLRRAFGGPVQDDLPPAFASLLARLGQRVQQPRGSAQQTAHGTRRGDGPTRMFA
jgi:hypothetical protein